MARRQPYQHPLPAGAPLEQDRDNAFETAEGGLEITLSDSDLDVQFVPEQPKPTEPAAGETKPEPVETPAPAPSEPRVEPPARSADDEAYLRLKAQLDRAQRERQEVESRLGAAEKERTTYEDTLRAERERSDQLRREHIAAQELAIENALRVAEREATAAEDTIQRALENADYQAAAKAQASLTQAYSDINRLREGKQALEVEKTKAAPAATTPPERRQDGGAVPERKPQSDWERIEAYITQPAHPPRVQEYMRQHYDDLFANNGARVNSLVAAHYEAKAKGLPDFSDEYFKHVDRYMGYDKSQQSGSAASGGQTPATNQTESQPQPVKQRSPIPPAAPVSRSAPTGQAGATSITLSPAQVEFCQKSGINPKDYAKEILVLNRASANPNYTGPRWTKDMGV